MKGLHKALLIALSLSGGMMICASLAVAAADITIDVAPPAPRIEVVPAPRAGYVWAPGHWEWNGRFHSWVAGSWIVAHGNYHWAPARWEQVGQRWHYVQGEWQK
jgi:hypothetical protein